MTTPDPTPLAASHAEWVDVARRKHADYLQVLAEAPDNHIAQTIRERSLADLMPRVLEAYDAVWGEVEAWLVRHRDDCADPDDPEARSQGWYALNDALDDFREHMHTGTPLDEPVRRTTEDLENER